MKRKNFQIKKKRNFITNKEKEKIRQIFKNNKFKNFKEFKEFRKKEYLREKRPKMVDYLHSRFRLRKRNFIEKGIFLKKPSFNEIKYPFHLNLKLINEYIKKK